MPPKKVGKKARKLVQKAREMIFTDAGPWAQGEKGVLQRIAYAFRVWWEENAVAPSSAAELLAVGWRGGKPPSAATVDNLAGQAYAKRPQSRRGLPNTQTMWALCDRIGVSAEWIFTGAGPKARRTVQEGGRLSRAEFARELAAHVMTECGDIYGIDVPLHCEEDRLFDVIISFVRREAQKDMSSFGVRQVEITDQTQLYLTASKSLKLIDDDHPEVESFAAELLGRFLSLTERLQSPTRTSRLPIIHQAVRQAILQNSKYVEIQLSSIAEFIALRD